MVTAKFSASIDIPGLTKQRTSHNERNDDQFVASKLVIIMVGLPARGKSYITKKLSRYLNWLQYETCVFNAGQRRRAISHQGVEPFSNPAVRHGAQSLTQFTNQVELGHPASFFDPNNEEALSQREVIALQTLDELLDWLLHSGGCIGIFDATNSTIHRRRVIVDRIRACADSSFEILFLESCCFNPALLEKNTLLKLSGPDYKDKDPKSALADFRQRIKLYEKAYVPLGDFEEQHRMPYLKMIDVGKKVITYEINGFLSAQVVEYLLNFNLSERKIWITRNGESLDDADGKIGRSSQLSSRGTQFAKSLSRFIKSHQVAWEENRRSGEPWVQQISQSCLNGGDSHQFHAREPQKEGLGVRVWTSMMTQAIQTSQFFDENQYDIKHIKMLDDLHAGKMEGLTFADIQAIYPDEMASRRKNSLHYRWPGPGGEGYVDVINRLRPVIIELERMKDHVLLITHRAVARVLLAYFQTLSRESLADIEVPLGAVFAVEPRPYGVAIERYQYNDENDWFDHVPGQCFE